MLEQVPRPASITDRPDSANVEWCLREAARLFLTSETSGQLPWVYPILENRMFTLFCILERGNSRGLHFGGKMIVAIDLRGGRWMLSNIAPWDGNPCSSHHSEQVSLTKIKGKRTAG